MMKYSNYYELGFKVDNPTFQRHNVKACCFENGRLYTFNAKAPESAWSHFINYARKHVLYENYVAKDYLDKQNTLKELLSSWKPRKEQKADLILNKNNGKQIT